jgi:anti-sigma B factor antagonist
MAVELSSVNRGSVVVVSLSGDALDAACAEKFRADIAPLIDGQKAIVLDFAGLKFVDSSGIGALLSCLRLAKTNGGEIRISGLLPNVRSLFELVRLDRLFEIFSTSDEAVASFAS